MEEQKKFWKTVFLVIAAFIVSITVRNYMIPNIEFIDSHILFGFFLSSVVVISFLSILKIWDIPIIEQKETGEIEFIYLPYNGSEKIWALTLNNKIPDRLTRKPSAVNFCLEHQGRIFVNTTSKQVNKNLVKEIDRSLLFEVDEAIKN